VDHAFQLFASFFPPVLAPDYLLALAGPVVETLGLTFGAMLAAFVVSLPLGVVAGLRLPGSGALLAALAAVRAIPDLTLAILCVILFGVGPGAGLIALSIYYTAAMAKMFADILRTAPRGPLQALSATGAGRLQVALFGLLPLKRADLLTYGAFEFECALRASVVIGAVGGGGIGTELVGSLQGFDFRHVTTQILALMLLVAVLDRGAQTIVRRPLWLLALVPAGLSGLLAYAPHLFALGHAAGVLAGMFPPRLSVQGWAELPQRIWETVWMALAGTLGAAAVALPLALVAARTLAPPWLALPIRRLTDALRTVPEVVWGLVLIAVAGVGPAAGTWALGLHSLGALTRLFADSLDNAPREPQLAIVGTGASAVVVGAYATLPLALGPMAAHALFRFEWNLRMATVLGLIGAGGVGQALYNAQQLFFYDQMLAYVMVTWAIVALADLGSERLRRRYGLLMSPLP
jgi:phosphonate transport system permease protein